jgi:hypothetical protein
MVYLAVMGPRWGQIAGLRVRNVHFGDDAHVVIEAQRTRWQRGRMIEGTTKKPQLRTATGHTVWLCGDRPAGHRASPVPGHAPGSDPISWPDVRCRPVESLPEGTRQPVSTCTDSPAWVPGSTSPQEGKPISTTTGRPTTTSALAAAATGRVGGAGGPNRISGGA